MKKLVKNSYPVFLGVCALFVFVYFFAITRLTPLAGDDWGYAINGMKGNPFVTLLEFYMNWSGRVVSELWGLLVAPRKALWNLLNPLLFTVIYLMGNFIANKKKSITGCILILFLMMSVSEYLRMETYTWIMGTTYVIPLCLAFVYFVLIEKSVFSNEIMKKGKIIGTTLLTLVIGMTMENVAAMMIVGLVLMLGYCFIQNKKIRYDLVLNFAGTVCGFMIMRLSPGSTFRTERDHAAWMELSLFEKIENQLSNFFRYTFLENKYLIFALALILILALVMKGFKWMKEHKLSTVVIFVSQMMAVVFSSANALASVLNFSAFSALTQIDLLGVRLWWIVYVITVFYALIVLIAHMKYRLMAVFFLMMAGGSNMVMLYSPIFGSRSSLYFVYFMFLVVVLVFSDIRNLDIRLDGLLCAGLLVMVMMRAKNWYVKYQQVHQTQVIREMEIQYYREHPEEDAWICRMPPYSVHGSDVEEGDTYHFETFKEYYGLDADQNIIFYWRESYSE